MHAEIVVTGTELLLGELVDTNSAMLARMLREIGLDLYYKTVVGDNRERIAAVLRLALERSDIVLTSGGLGPTVDDVTREAVADVTGRPLVFHQHLLDQIAARFARFGRPMSENNRRQAYVPEGAIILENREGTAPGFIVEDPRGTIICLPGVPRELEHLMRTYVLPYLKRRLGQEMVILPRVLRTCSIGESQIDAQIGDLMRGSNPTVGLAAHAGQVDIRITAKASTHAEAEQLIAPVEAEVRRRLGDVIFGSDGETLEGVVSELLVQRDATLALVDSLTGGQVADMLRDVGTPTLLLADQRYVDAPAALAGLRLEAVYRDAGARRTAEEAAERVRVESGSSLGLALLGMLPEESRAIPMAYVALSDGAARMVRAYRFGSENELTRRWITVRALDMLRRHLLGLAPFDR
ncbi:MAG: competence/damage-inducible protein A [Ardenticatenia bacterium]|jgi:nicotinamide-nucleotide amidase|nr:MAG: competence/damage-inducible protein A [Ardenticatenia bacterium]